MTWKQANQNDPNYGYGLMRQDHAVREAVTRSLLEEQGWLCAYTGRRIEEGSCHIEHMRPQKYTPKAQRPPKDEEVEHYRGEDVSYANMVACYPEPNRPGKTPYGAERKGNWPAPEQHDQFVRPTQGNAGDQFLFDRRGRISGTTDAARATIKELSLCHKELTRLRHAAIEGARVPKRGLYLNAKQIQRVIERLDGETGRLTPFTFAVRQGLAAYIPKKA